MTMTRREIIGGGGAILAGLFAGPKTGYATPIFVNVTMRGKNNGAHVWFDPVGIHIQPGQIIRWTNRDPANSHTVTAYHPDISGRPLRIPVGAAPFDSGYLLPEESFTVTFSAIGVYDYYCVPHEHAGMVGRIVVGAPSATVADAPAGSAPAPLPDVALKAFPSVNDIVAKGVVRRG
ncbi:plastocyanin/azurin family copper-binding protein [Phyllobacterium endophyticum]|uniref:plastocyanin/azurin family copper-binding protein n=1 Tax=Phyllobacterium endophyticum TaxID=1149773 RepID=UPI0011CB5001|nr:plastocyanin/azurin family copper-binding protein [Phyllobacterium endophyticum]TXR47065.1 hypothetical protein FVA77_21795 [Phyllobacterium endophyticum]